MYLRLDKRAPWRYTRGLFVFLNGLKSRLTHQLKQNPESHGSSSCEAP